MSFAILLDSRPPGEVLSPSQTERYDECIRRWAIEYIGGVRPPQHPSARKGSAIHKILERWLQYGIPPDTKTPLGRIAFKMIAHLPPPGTGVVERRFYFTTRNGVSYTGFIDWSGIFHDWPTVIDHKTTGSIAQYAKSEDDLSHDMQALTYTVAGCYGFEVDSMQLMWGYGQTKGKNPETRPVYAKLHLPIVEAQFDQILDPYGQEIVWHKEHPRHPMSYPANPRACDNYGGCPHQSLCQISEAERFDAMNMPAQPTLADRLAPGFAPPQNGTAAGAYVPPGMQPAPGYPPQSGGYPVPQNPAAPYNPAQQGFAPPQQPPAGYPIPPNAAPMGYPAPNTFTPPQAPQLPQQQGLAYPPGYANQPPQATAGGPNAPESGQGAGLAVEPTPKKGRGRPRKDTGDGATAEAMRQASVGGAGAGLTQQAVFLQGVLAMISNPSWNGSVEAVQHAGQMAVHVYGTMFPNG